MQDRSRIARATLLAVEEAERREALRKPQVGITEGLRLLHRGDVEPLGISALPALRGALGGTEKILPPGGLGGGGHRPQQQQERESSRHRAEGNDGGRFSRMACIPSRTSSPMKVSISSASD